MQCLKLSFITKSICAALFISLGVAVLLTWGLPLGAIFFALGLFCVCSYKVNLFTGAAGYARTFTDYINLVVMLVINAITGYITGFALSSATPTLQAVAMQKVLSWNVETDMIKAIMCGIIMYLAVDLYRNGGTVLGIFFGVPLFIFAGFQHSIANFITMGAAMTFSWMPLFHAFFNWVGAVFIRTLLDMSKQDAI